MRTLIVVLILTLSQNINATNYQGIPDSLSKDSIQIFHQLKGVCVLSNVSFTQPTYNKAKDYIPWITALLVALISGLVTWKVSMKQIKSNKENIVLQVNAANISNKRQEWIDNLRKNIAAIIKNHMILVSKLTTGTASTYIYQDEEFREILELVTLVDLSLNPNEEDSKYLMTLLRDYTNDYNFVKPDSFTRIETIIKTTQTILKSEWDRVKNSQ